MLLSLNLLKKYLILPKSLTPQKIQLGLTKSTVEVEKIHVQGQDLEKIIVGRIKKIETMLQADKLKLTTVDVGNHGQLKIVCGGSNLYEGMVSAIALPGAMVRWHGKGELVKIEKARLRGVDSEGMICTASEIGLGNEFPHQEAEVMDLKLKNPRLGQDLKISLGLDDVVIEIDNKSLTNRPDLWSHYGMARELAVIFGLTLKPLKSDKSFLKIKKAKDLSILVQEKELCPRYLGAVVENVSIKESPEWLKKSLTACGLRPINNVVDITNYVLLALGQPMHAFDFFKIKGMHSLATSKASEGQTKSKLSNKIQIIVRRAEAGERIATLDGVERELEKEMLVIADAKGPAALAGIMGGLETSVGQETKKIILESANFDPIVVRKTSQRLGLRTEASVRYEKSLHSNLAALSMQLALELIEETLPEARVSEMLDIDHSKTKEQKLEFDYRFLVKRIGIDIGQARVLKILKDLGFLATLNKKTQKIKISVPWWRATGDISIPEDIVEEVARIYGYDQLDPGLELVNLEPAKYQPRYDFEEKIKSLLTLGGGMTEVYNYPWADSSFLSKLGFREELIEILNPPTQKNKFLKNSLVPGLLQNAEDNLRFFADFKLFELARVFLPGTKGAGKFDGQDRLPSQPHKLSGILVGDRKERLFFVAKDLVNQVLVLAGLETGEYRLGKQPDYLENGQVQMIFGNGKELGYVGRLALSVARQFDFHNKQVVLFELDFDELSEIFKNKSILKYQHPPKFPEVSRDLSVEVDASLAWQELRRKIDDVYNQESSLWAWVDSFLSSFDLGNGKKSVAFRMKYSAPDRTLTEVEVSEIENKILERLKDGFGARQR